MPWQLIGGLSGAASVIAGAYGAHGLHSRLAKQQQAPKDQEKQPLKPTPTTSLLDPTTPAAVNKDATVSSKTTGKSSSSPPAQASPVPPEAVWSRAVAYQQLHSVGLLLVPLLTAPKSVQQLAAGSLFTAGILLFSGGLYAQVLTGDRRVSKGAPFGGMCFIAGWVTLALGRRPFIL